MKKAIKIGVVCLVRNTYDMVAANVIFEQAKSEMEEIPDVDWVYAEELVISKEDAVFAAHKLVEQNVEGISIISGTFHLGHLALMIDRIVNKPVLLWAFHELPYNGGKIRLNSVCGLNLNASNLYKSGNQTYHYTISDSIDKNWLDAIRMKVVLEQSHVGIAGFRADGFFNLGVDELDNFRKTGVLLDHYELEEMYNREVNEAEVKEIGESIKKIFHYGNLKEEQLNKLARLCISTEDFLEENRLDAVAVRCWPEYAAKYGIAPCAMMSILQGKGRILACEGDVEGAMTMLALKAIGAETPFLADLSQVFFEENYALMWHCGVAPYSLWDEKSERSLDTYFAGGKGVTAGFVLKKGDINVVRIDTANGKTRICIGKGEVLPMEKELAGTYAKVRFHSNIRQLLDTVINNGIAHHVVLVYGDYIEKIKIFARIMKFEIIEL